MFSRKFLLDLTERVAVTFAFAFVSVFAFSDLSTAKDAAIAGGAAVLSLVKGVLAAQLGASDSASLAREVGATAAPENTPPAA